MPGPEEKNLLAGVTEFGKGVFVTAAMLRKVHEDACFLGMEVVRPESSEMVNPDIRDVVERLKRLEGLIRSIFDGHVLIDGRFIKIIL